MKIIIPLAKERRRDLVLNRIYNGIDFRFDKILKTRGWIRTQENIDNTFLILKNGILERLLFEIIKRWRLKGVNAVFISGDCNGAAMTVLSVLPQILESEKEDFLVDLSDIYFESELNSISEFSNMKSTAMTFNSRNSRYSYIMTDSKNNVTAAAEKKVISNSASVGVYYFKEISDYIDGIQYSLENKEECTYKGMYYICPLFNGISKKCGKKAQILSVSNVVDIKEQA